MWIFSIAHKFICVCVYLHSPINGNTLFGMSGWIVLLATNNAKKIWKYLHIWPKYLADWVNLFVFLFVYFQQQINKIILKGVCKFVFWYFLDQIMCLATQKIGRNMGNNMWSINLCNIFTWYFWLIFQLHTKWDKSSRAFKDFLRTRSCHACGGPLPPSKRVYCCASYQYVSSILPICEFNPTNMWVQSYQYVSSILA